ncbi:F-box domain-containing protein [Mycena venus]|uniref:F-box domain-containing protein n=1 Tax=Mycena venus TaxID=2733690 RepID=A0A8H6XW43_9AGAR|nr:F-box domain-containing protein [Mycena venus]
MDRILLTQSSPILNLPYELLADIMLRALAPRVDEWGRITFASPEEVLVLCRICSHWRSVALNTPKLWVTETFPVTRFYEPSLTMTKMFLERSAPLPISISLYCQIPYVLPVLVTAAHRWRSFRIMYDNRDGLDLAASLSGIEGSLEHLEKLQLDYCPDVHAALHVFQSAPRLHDITLDTKQTTSLIIPPMPCAQLTRLSLKCGSPQWCLNIIMHCKNLVSAKVLTTPWLEASEVSDTVETSSLQCMEQLDISVDVRSAGVAHLEPFLRRLRLPALKSLTLTLSVRRSRHPLFNSFGLELISFLARSPRVEYLLLCNCVFPEDMPYILECTPHLTELHFHTSDGAEIDDDFFEMLWYDATDPASLVPKLETLDLLDVGHGFWEESLAQMIRSRWWSDEDLSAMAAPPGVARLKRIRFENYSDSPKKFTEEFKEEMKGYCAQGLQQEGLLFPRWDHYSGQVEES